MRLYYEFAESVRLALGALRGNLLRTILTSLGIIIGITLVTAMGTVISGIEADFDEQMNELGADVLYVEKWPWAGGPNLKWWEYINRPNITADLAEVINERSDLAQVAVPVASTSRTAQYGSRSAGGIGVQGAGAAFPLVNPIDLDTGRFYTALEERSARSVAVIGSSVAEALFPAEEPLGKQIRLGGQRFTVIGVLAREGSGAEGGGSDDNRVIIPYDTFARFYGAAWRSITVRVKLNEGVELDAGQDELTGILRAARGLDALEEDDFEINQQQALREQLAPIKAAIFGIGIGLTALALLVGGIGVMNIMFVSVKERTREIGIRKAIGAKRRTILMQFLVEAVVVCLVGGLIGAGISALLALGVCVGVGVLFGLAPAWQAAKADPIEALRYE
jgi:putative ABC transport system permease protein